MPQPINPDPNLPPDQQRLRWTTLEKRLEDIERGLSQSVKFGPVPAQAGSELFGQTIRAAQLYGLDTVGNPPVPRIQLGNLAAYTDPSGVASPAGDGIRILDANGFIILDSSGVAGVGNPLGGNGQGPGQVISSTTYIATTPAITFSFTLPRQIHCLFIGGAQGHIQTGTGIGYVRIAIYDSVPTLVASTGDAKMNTTGTTLSSAGGIPLETGTGSVAAIGPGTYTARIECKVDSGSTFYFDQGSLIGIQMGG
jgi:hypothetical protein